MTTQAAPSFDAEYARVIKAVETAQARGDDFEQVVNACMEALKRAGITNDAPLDQLVARLAGERDESERRVLALIADYARQSAQITALHAQIERKRSARVSSLQTQLKETQRECARLLTIVGTETPIAAFDLATTWRTEKQAYMEEIAELESDLARCAAAHQKVIEQTAHYGAALTELAITGNETANTALGTAPYEDSTRATYRNLTTAYRWAQLWKRGAQAQMRACGYWKDEARRAAEALRAQTAAANAEQGRLADLVLRTGHECAELTRELATLRAAWAARLALGEQP